jgi:hypothetical protein
MQTPDIINGCFEAAGSISVFANVRRILKDKAVKGIDLKAATVFTSWSIWNLAYYPMLDQWLSFTGGLAIVAGNATWLALALKYRTP